NLSLDRRDDQRLEAVELAADEPPGDQGLERGRGSILADASTAGGPADRRVASPTDDRQLVLAQAPGFDQRGEQRGLGLGLHQLRAELVEAVGRVVAPSAQPESNLALELDVAEPGEGADRSAAQLRVVASVHRAPRRV